jgi:hypothetical protein
MSGCRDVEGLSSEEEEIIALVVKVSRRRCVCPSSFEKSDGSETSSYFRSVFTPETDGLTDSMSQFSPPRGFASLSTNRPTTNLPHSLKLFMLQGSLGGTSLGFVQHYTAAKVVIVIIAIAILVVIVTTYS